MNTKTYEASLDRMKPVGAPKEQLQSVAALLGQLRPAVPQERESGPTQGAYNIVSPAGVVTELPESVFYFLRRVTEVLARGDELALVPVAKPLTTQQAADILNVSRQYLVRLLDEGRIPSTKTGTHRRLLLKDVLAYKEQRDHDREEALDELAQLSQAYGGYQECYPDKA